MPFAGFDDWDSCVRTMTDEEGHDEESAEDICGALQAEAKSDHGNVEELRDALAEGAGLIADVGVDLVSGVDVPAIDSKWVMTKSGGGRKGHDYRSQSAIVVAKDADTEQRITYAAAMIPREPDKEGDVAPTPTVEKAAHGFLKGDGGIDTDHSLIDGEGEPVESWVLKEERTFDLPGGGSETYPRGTWMLGVEWGAEAWERIQEGELTGLSIYGMAEHVPLERSASADTHKGADSETEGMGEETDDNGGPTLGELASSMDDLSETVATVKDTIEEQNQPGDIHDRLDEMADAIAESEDTEREDALAVKEDLKAVLNNEVGRGEGVGKGLGDAVEMLAEDDDLDASPADIEDALAPLYEGEGDTEETEASATEKDADADDEANLSKGSDAAGTAQKGVTEETGGTGLSYAALADEEAE